MSPSNKDNKKRKAEDTPETASKKSNKSDELEIDSFEPLTLEGIRDKIRDLSERVPAVPEDTFGLNDVLQESVIREWAATLQAVLEEFNLLVCCVSTATYKWGTDRSGAADQNLSLPRRFYFSFMLSICHSNYNH